MEWARSIKTKVVELFRKKQIKTKAGEWLEFGNNDDYSLMLSELAEKSSTLQSCIETKARFIAGDGVEAVNNQLANARETYQDVINQIAYSLATFNAFCIYITAEYDESLSLKLVYQVYPIEFFRFKDYTQKEAVLLELDEKNNLVVRKVCKIVASKKDFERELQESNENIKNFACVYVDMIKTTHAYQYPRASYHSVIKDVLSEIEIKQSKFRDVASGFSARIIATIYQNSDPLPEEIAQDTADFENFLGSEGATFMLRYAKNKESKIDVESISLQDLSKIYEYCEKSVSENIMKVFRIPQVLFGIPTAGKLGTSQEIIDAIKYVQKLVVHTEQEKICKFLINFEIVQAEQATIKNITIF